MIRFVETAFFSEFNSSFSYVRRPPAADSVVKVRTIRFVSICPLCLWAVQTGGVTQGGDFQNLVDDVAHGVLSTN
jgi:hypothetical protein